MDNNKTKRTDYGNWVPLNMIRAGWISIIILGIAAVACWLRLDNWFVTGMLGVLWIICFLFTIYMQRCRDIFDFEKGGMMGKIHEYLVEHLDWDGNGKLLDIGCGAGALTIRYAKKYEHADLTGMDYWGKEWNYAKEQCEMNAKMEGVDKRVRFQKGDAANLERKLSFIPQFVTAPWMIKGVGILYGRK